jgi:small conductance mechanosensitive channel
VLDIPVSYATDLDKAIDVIKETSDRMWRDREWRGVVLEEPDVWGVEAFGDSAILLRVVLKVVPAQQWAVSRELRMRVKAAFDDAGIEIPFNTYSIWMRNEDEGAAPSVATAASDARAHRRHRRARTGEYDSAPPDTAQDVDGDGDIDR